MHAYGALAIDTIGYGNMTHKLPAILPSLPEPLSARLFGTATQHHLKAGEALFVAEILATDAIRSSGDCSKSS